MKIRVLISAVLAYAATASGQEVRPRRGVEVPSGPVQSVGSQGVTVQVGGGTLVVAWDQVAGVVGAHAAEAEAYEAVADSAWRARTRLERGDLAGAESLFEKLFERYAAETGPTTELVTGGLLTCRLARGAQTLAVDPWICYVGAVQGAPTRSLSRGGDVRDPTDLWPVDGGSGLAPMLPPIWLNGPGVAALSQQEWRTPEGRAGVLSKLYREAVRWEVSATADLPARPGADDGLELVWDIVAARAGDGQTRAGARTNLRARLAKAPSPWIAAWCHVAIGRSLLIEQEEESKLLGVAELAVVPAAMERVCPYLTGVALAEMALDTLRRGDTKGAVAIRGRIMDRFPGHPVLDWEPLRHWAAEAPPAPKAAGSPPEVRAPEQGAPK